MTRIALAAVTAALLLPRSADACSCLWADDHGFLIEESRQLPSNARGLVWIGSTAPEPEHFEVVRVDAGNETGVPFVLSPLSLSRRSMRAFLVE